MRKIYIRRKEVNSFLPKEVRVAARVAIGSIYVGRQPLKGIDGDEAKKLLPQVLGLPADHPDFPRVEKDYWASMRVKIPFAGKELDMTVREDGTPENVEDYITYRWCQKHRQVAESKQEMDAVSGKKFYIYDPQKDLLKKNKSVQIGKDADKEFITIIPESKVNDLEFVENAIIKNREYSIAHRDEILEYAKEFEWKAVLKRHYIPAVEHLVSLVK